MRTISLEAMAGQVGLSVRQVQRYLRCLGIRPVRIVDGRNHYHDNAAVRVTTAVLAARESRADAIREACAAAKRLAITHARRARKGRGVK